MKVALWKLQIIQLQKGVYISGVIIKGNPRIQNETDRWLSTFRKIIKTYFIRPLKHHIVYIHYNNKKTEVKTGKNGEFRLRLNELSIEDVYVSREENGPAINVLQDYPVRFNEMHTKYLVITDIDDTILHSYATNSVKKLRKLLFHPPIKRKRVEASYKAFSKLKSSHFHFIYLSRSEYNLFNLISTFIIENKLPIGPIFLRKFTLWKKLLFQKGKYEFKFDVLDELIRNFPRNKIVFFGDDSQYDLDTYVHFAKLFPSTILKIFIHRIKGEGSKKEAKWNIDEAYIKDKVYFYNEFNQIEEQINTIVNEATTSG
jgi:phosphatidate phosphatase APP1